jgi:hypothetical protein
MARPLLAALLALAAAALLIVACNDKGDFLLDENEDNGTPAFFQRTPESTGEPDAVGSPPVEGATPVPAFTVSANGSVNVRTEPTSEGGRGTVARTLGNGDTATVVASIPGEEVDSGNDVWYQLDDGNFVYSGAVTEEEAPPEEPAEETPEGDEGE